MKIRNGFVSNSSSSSFLIVGVQGHWIEELLERDTIQDQGFGVAEGSKGIDYYGGEGYYDNDDYPLQPDYAGMKAGQLLKENKPLQEIKEMFVEKVREQFNIDIPVDSVELYYGRASGE